MSELALKRRKLVRSINEEEKNNYFRLRREQMLHNLEAMANVMEDTPEALWLRQLIRRSLVQNQLLQELRNSSLLERIGEIMRTTDKGRDVELILVLLGNLLLEEITLDEKQGITAMCLYAFELRPLQIYMQEDWNVTGMLFIVHNLSSICSVIKFIDEEMGVKCESVILDQIIAIAEQLVSGVCEKYRDQDTVDIIEKIFLKIASILRKLLYTEPEYRGEIKTLFSRNFGKFYNILELHSVIVSKMERCAEMKVLHEGLLQVEETVSEDIDMLDFPMYFQSRHFLSICLQEIFHNREERWSKMTLCILINLFQEFAQTNIYAVLVIIEEQINLLGKETFFKRLLCIDSFSFQRLSLIKLWICTEGAFGVFQSFFVNGWKDIVDVCCQTLRENERNYEKEDMALSVLIISSEKVSQMHEKHSFVNYLQSIGGESLLDEVMGRCAEEGGCSDGSDVLQSINDKTYWMMELLRY